MPTILSFQSKSDKWDDLREIKALIGLMGRLKKIQKNREALNYVPEALKAQVKKVAGIK